MSRPATLQSSYVGMDRDKARHALPPGYCWNLVDYLPSYGFPARARGPWLQASPSMSESGSATSVPAVAYAPFSGGHQLVAITSNGSLWKVDSDVSATDKGTSAIPIQRPVFFKNLLIVPGSDGATTPSKYDGSAAPASLGGTPPQGNFADVYKERLLLASSSAEPRRIWFSGPGDPQVWDTTDGWLNASKPITGLAAMANVVLVFSVGGCERLRGSTPPPSRDMELEPKFEQGLHDARSIVKMGDQVIWANTQGIFITDGAAMDDLTRSCGALKFWKDLMAGYTASWALAAGEFNGMYIISVLNGTSAETLAIDVSRRTWFRLSNMPAKMFAESMGAAPNIWFGHCGSSGVVLGSCANFWTRASSPDVDPFGTGPNPTFESVYYRGEPGSRRINNLWLGVDFQAASQSNYLKIGVTRNETDTTYDDVTYDDGTLFKVFSNAGYQRTKIPLKFKGSGFGLKISQVGTADENILFDIEATIRELERSK